MYIHQWVEGRPLVLNLGRKDRLYGNISFPFFLSGADEVYWAKDLHAEATYFGNLGFWELPRPLLSTGKYSVFS